MLPILTPTLLLRDPNLFFLILGKVHPWPVDSPTVSVRKKRAKRSEATRRVFSWMGAEATETDLAPGSGQMGPSGLTIYPS